MREREREREREMHTLVVTTRRVVNKKSTALKIILEKGSEISYKTIGIDLWNEESSMDSGIYRARVCKDYRC